MTETLRLPPEIRYQIYYYLHWNPYPTIFNLCKCFVNPSRDMPRQICQSPAIVQTSHTLREEFRQMLTAQPLHISCHSDAALFHTTLPCLHIISPPFLPIIHLQITPFLLGSSIGQAYGSLNEICGFLFLHRHHIPELRITIDGHLPRIRPPWLIGEVDIERAPLVTVLLLEPFTLVCDVPTATIKIDGGTPKAPWTATPLLQAHAAYVEARMRRGGDHYGGDCSNQAERGRERLSHLQDLLDDKCTIWSLLNRPHTALERIVDDPRLSGFQYERE